MTKIENENLTCKTYVDMNLYMDEREAFRIPYNSMIATMTQAKDANSLRLAWTIFPFLEDKCIPIFDKISPRMSETERSTANYSIVALQS